MRRARVEWIVRTRPGAGDGRGDAALEFGIRDIGPLALNADQRRSGGRVEVEVLILGAAPRCILYLSFGGIASGGWIDFREAEPQTAASAEERRQIRGI